ncbi:MAG TPA: oxaloacetate decarboxylase [Candidatus Tectomicrobia bacterium]|nr:oxaloacetate decarboxylase [Candidatus Tectomicrobia bacterium]
MTLTERRTRYRNVLAGSECIHPASVFDPISARMAEAAGFEIGMLAGSTASGTVLGAPDLVVLTLTEFAEQIHRIARASSLSLMVDADHGYGNALNVIRTVEELEAAGVSALTIEDTLLPPRFGQKQGEELISVAEFVGKLKAAVTARQDASLVIIGRIAALRSDGLQEAITRGKACVDAGVDAIFLTGARTREEIEAIHKEIPLPLLLGSTPPTIGDGGFLAAHGVRIALQGHVPFAVVVKALYDTYKHLKAGGSPAALKDQAASEELMHLALNRDAYRRWQRDYLGQP